MNHGPIIQIVSQPERANDWLTITQILSNIGTFLAAFGALIALFLISLRTIDAQFNENFRKIYDEFWFDEDIAKARIIISYSAKYEMIKETLQKMASEPWPDSNEADSSAVVRFRGNYGNYILEKAERKWYRIRDRPVRPLTKSFLTKSSMKSAAGIMSAS